MKTVKIIVSVPENMAEATEAYLNENLIYSNGIFRDMLDNEKVSYSDGELEKISIEKLISNV